MFSSPFDVLVPSLSPEELWWPSLSPSWWTSSPKFKAYQRVCAAQESLNSDLISRLAWLHDTAWKLALDKEKLLFQVTFDGNFDVFVFLLQLNVEGKSKKGNIRKKRYFSIMSRTSCPWTHLAMFLLPSVYTHKAEQWTRKKVNEPIYMFVLYLSCLVLLPFPLSNSNKDHTTPSITIKPFVWNCSLI